jgi:hypothetical protein
LHSLSIYYSRVFKGAEPGWPQNLVGESAESATLQARLPATTLE